MGFMVILLSTGTALANAHSGSLCNANAADAPSIVYTQFGVHNISSVARAVVCGGVTDGTVTSVTITVYDRDPAADVSCTVLLEDAAGGAVFATTLASSGFSSAPITLSTGLPAFAGFIELQCSIPPANATNGVSHVTSYSIGDSL